MGASSIFGDRRTHWRDRLFHQPLLEGLEPRLPLGDTLLGLLAAGNLLDGTLPDTDSIIAPEPNLQEIRVAGAERSAGWHALSPRRAWEGSATLNESVANGAESVATWQRTLAAANPKGTSISVNSNKYLATWPQVSTPVPGSAMGRLNPAVAGGSWRGSGRRHRR